MLIVFSLTSAQFRCGRCLFKHRDDATSITSWRGFEIRSTTETGLGWAMEREIRARCDCPECALRTQYWKSTLKVRNGSPAASTRSWKGLRPDP